MLRRIQSVPFRSFCSSATIKVVNPATCESIAELPMDSASSVVQKAALARKAQKTWRNVSLNERMAMIKNYRDALSKSETIDTFAASMSAETGKPVNHSKGEIKATLERIDFFLNNVEKLSESRQYEARGGVDESLSFEPLGVVGNISAWNYPYFVGHNVIIPALLTGNTVLYKPSEYALLTGNHINDLLNKFLPENVFQCLVGDGSVGGALLKESDDQGRRIIDGIFFTGSNATGAKIGEIAGRRFIKSQLELGGKDSAYVHKDVDVDKVAASIADGALFNNGQSCCSVERVFVHENIYVTFLEKLKEHVASFKLGDPTKPDTYLGPLTRAQQADVLDAQVEDARSKGATILMGGKRTTVQGLSGVYYEPTVVTDCTRDMKVMREESFGPIVAVSSVSYNEVVDKMNDCEYGLTNSVFSKDKTVAEEILPQLQSGTVYWNSCDRVSPQLPWSGRYGSGVGATLGEVGITTFLQPKGYHMNGNF